MKYIITESQYKLLFENNEMLNKILDKINKSGIESLTDLEKDWLNAHSIDNDEKTDAIEREMGESSFKSSDGYFRFELIDGEDYGDYLIYRGTMYVPDLEIDGEVIEGEIGGEIEVDEDGINLNFEKDGYDIYEFCEGLEHELDKFAEDIVNELNEE